jgi:hypothetical protein
MVSRDDGTIDGPCRSSQVDVHNDDGMTGRCKVFGDGQPDTRTGSGDDGNFVLFVFHDGISLGNGGLNEIGERCSR